MRVIQVTATPGERVLRVCAMLGFGVRVRGNPREEAPLGRRVQAGVNRLGPGESLFITGASGAGKTRMLSRIRAYLRSAGDVCVECGSVPVGGGRSWRNCAVIDLLEGTIQDAMRVLASAGLSEGALLVRTAAELSEGQRWRLQLALAMQRCERERIKTERVFLIVDELVANLDGLTGRCVCKMLSKWAARLAVSIIAAGPRARAGGWLDARMVVRLKGGRS